ncbi:MAG: MATE family efflux transporter [Planctomycetota bacterium]
MTDKPKQPDQLDVEAFESVGGEAHALPDPYERKARPMLDEHGRLLTGRLAGMSMNRAIWVLSWPILIESYLNSFVGLVDTVLAAGISSDVTDAIGGSSYIMWFLSIIGLSIGIGATALISRAVGGGKQAVANAALGQTLILSTALGIIAGIGVYLFAPTLARVMNLNEPATEALIVYMRIVSFATPLNAILLAGLACCRAAGDAYRPLWIMAFVNIVNVIVSFALAGVDFAVTTKNEQGEFIRKVLIPDFLNADLGIVGIALGTVVAWTLGALIVLVWLTTGASGITLKRRRLAPHWHTMRRLVRVALPGFLESVGMWFGNFLIILVVGMMQATGPGFLGTHIVIIRIEAFSFLPGFAMGMAASTIMGQYLGAGSPKLASVGGLRCTGLGVAIMGTLGLMFILFPEHIIGLMSQQDIHMERGVPLLRATGYFQIPFAIGMVLRTGMRGSGDARVAAIITWSSTYLVRLPLAWYLSGVDFMWGDSVLLTNPGPDWGLYGLWLGLLWELVVRCTLFTGRFIQGGWKHVKV